MPLGPPEDHLIPPDEIEVLNAAQALGAAFWRFATGEPRPSPERVATVRDRIVAMLDVQFLQAGATEQ